MRQSISGFVDNCKNDIIKSPSKLNKTKTTNWFDFCLITTNKRYRCVCFYNHHLETILSVNGSTEEGLEITDVEFKNNEYQIDINTSLKKIKLDKFDSPPSEPLVTIKSIYNTPLNTDVTVKCKITSVTNEVRGKYTIWNYELSDKTGVVSLSSFEKLDLDDKSSYELKNVRINHFSNEKLLKITPCSIIVPLDDAIKLDNDEKEEIKYPRVVIKSLVKGKTFKVCPKCPAQFDDTAEMYICECGYVSDTCDIKKEPGQINIVKDGASNEISLKFHNDLFLKSEFGMQIESFTPDLFKKLIKSKTKYDLVVVNDMVSSITSSKDTNDEDIELK